MMKQYQHHTWHIDPHNFFLVHFFLYGMSLRFPHLRAWMEIFPSTSLNFCYIDLTDLWHAVQNNTNWEQDSKLTTIYQIPDVFFYHFLFGQQSGPLVTNIPFYYIHTSVGLLCRPAPGINTSSKYSTWSGVSWGNTSLIRRPAW